MTLGVRELRHFFSAEKKKVHCRYFFRRGTIVEKSHRKDVTTVINASRNFMADWKLFKTPLASGLAAIERHLWDAVLPAKA